MKHKKIITALIIILLMAWLFLAVGPVTGTMGQAGYGYGYSNNKGD